VGASLRHSARAVTLNAQNLDRLSVKLVDSALARKLKDLPMLSLVM
jgi:hypothetical protein